MAIVDPEQQTVAIGIVYDGPPEAGKTTSLRALARSFGHEVYTPEERDGRTVYFDWLEHTGGRFDGGPIRCQVLSVPGQQQWQHRRRHLLDQADVVVFVGDTSTSGWPSSLERLHKLLAWRDQRNGPPIGVVLQANRRDAPDAVALAELTRAASSLRVALVESIALDGSGVREAFVFAVRLALDRVRELQRTRQLPSGSSRLSGERLLSQLRELEPQPPDSPREPDSLEEPVILSPPGSDRGSRGFGTLWADQVPSGWVWPPVEGRIVLREALSGIAEDELEPCDDFSLELPTGFRLSTSRAALFDDADQGRRTLIDWARLHSSAGSFLSKSRCIVLSRTGLGRFRLWQIVRVEPSLRELFIADRGGERGSTFERSTEMAERLLGEACVGFSAVALWLDCNLDNVGLSESGRPLYIGEVPLPARPRPSSLDHWGISE